MTIDGYDRKLGIYYLQEIEYYYEVAEYYDRFNGHLSPKEFDSWQHDIFTMMIQELKVNPNIPNESVAGVIKNARLLLKLLIKEENNSDIEIDELPPKQKTFVLEDLSYFL